jgi:predicted ATP-grasp superfamily ATP-dependent carboligase
VIDVERIPPLRDPILVAAFEGWNDAGEAASAVVTHLRTVWRATLVATVDPEEYYDFQVNRPRVAIDNGRRRIIWPTTRIFLASDTAFGRDVILVQGIEPSTRWRTFTIELVELAGRLGITTIVTLGALLADVPHTRPLPVTTTSDDAATRSKFDIDDSTYQGPTGIVGVVSDAAGRAGFDALSCWAAVPHYAGGAPSPKATLGLLGALEDALDITIPRGDLDEDARAWERGVDELAQSDDEVAEYVASLEEATDAVDLPEASGDAIAREFDRYLRNLKAPGDDPEG